MQIMNMDEKSELLNCISKRKSMWNVSFLQRVLIFTFSNEDLEDYVKTRAATLACLAAFIQLSSVTGKARHTALRKKPKYFKQ